MSRQGSTKEKILKLISEGKDNLSDISRKLDLAPSTVSKHIHDLENSRVIEQKSNTHVKKWKYYRVTQGANGFIGNRNQGSGLATKRNFAMTAAVACALIAMFAFFQVYATHGTSSTTYVSISITDPPIVPNGTQALYVNYSSVRVHADYRGESDWIAVNSSGRLELMGLINESQVIGEARVASNATIDQVDFNISSASITVDNVTYPVAVASKQMAAMVVGGEVNGTSGVLLDFSPVVTPTYFDNATRFVMSPSLRAAMVPSGEFGNPGRQSFGQHRPVPMQYENLFNDSGVSLKITNATLTPAGNYTSFRITLNNDGDENVTVVGTTIMGDIMPYAAPNAQIPGAPAANMRIPGPIDPNCSAAMNVSAGPEGHTPEGSGRIGMRDAALRGGERVFRQSNSTIAINASAMVAFGKACGADRVLIRLPMPANDIQISGIGSASGLTFSQEGLDKRFMLMHPVGVSFSVGNNATLYLQFPDSLPELPAQGGGYVLAPGATVTLLYTGGLVTGNLGALKESPNDSSYFVTVLTDRGIAQSNFTST